MRTVNARSLRQRQREAEPRVEYVEGEWGYGWWCEGWVDHDAFFRAVCADAWEQLHLPPEEIGTPEATRDGYVRQSTTSDEWSVRLDEKPNGGRRATYVWWTF